MTITELNESFSVSVGLIDGMIAVAHVLQEMNAGSTSDECEALHDLRTDPAVLWLLGIDGRRHGKVNNWVPERPYGFITDDAGVAWFVSRGSIPSEMRMIPAGTAVTFDGNPEPQSDRKYPEAVNVQVDGMDGDE